MNKELLKDAGLSEQQAEIVLLREGDLTRREIAHRLDVEVGTVDSQIARVRSKARRAELLLGELPDDLIPDVDDES